MSTPASRAAGRRGAIIAGVLLTILLLTLEISRPSSVIMGLFEPPPPKTPVEQILDVVKGRTP